MAYMKKTPAMMAIERHQAKSKKDSKSIASKVKGTKRQSGKSTVKMSMGDANEKIC